jgi:hypothetical protein
MADVNPGLRPGLSSGVTAGLDSAMVVLTHPRREQSIRGTAEAVPLRRETSSRGKAEPVFRSGPQRPAVLPTLENPVSDPGTKPIRSQGAILEVKPVLIFIIDRTHSESVKVNI